MESDDYIKTFLADKVERVIADFPALNKLTDFKVYLNFARFCLAPKLHFLLRTFYLALSALACATLDI